MKTRSYLAPLALALSLAPTADAQVPVVQRLDLDPAGLVGDGDCFQATISSDGSHVAFASTSTNLVPGQVGAVGTWNLFVRDVRTGATVQANLDSAGAAMQLDAIQGAFPRPNMSLSGDGRYVVFVTPIGDPLFGDTNNQADVYRRDLQTGRTELVSVGMDDKPTQSSLASYPTISEDGRYVAFSGFGKEFAIGATTGPIGTNQAYVRDLATGYTELITRPGSWPFSGEQCAQLALSGDGQRVAVIVANNAGGPHELSLVDRVTGVRTDFGPITQGTVFGATPTLSIDRTGSRIVFDSELNNLVVGDVDNDNDVFVVETATGVISQVNLATGGVGTPLEAHYGTISPDGRYASFEGYGTGYSATMALPEWHVFLHDLESGLTTLGSISHAGHPGTALTTPAAKTFTTRALSEDAGQLAYTSNFTNLAGTPTPGAFGAFVLDRNRGASLRVTNLVAGGTATVEVGHATGSGAVLVAFSVTGQGPIASTWGLIDLSPPLHTHHVAVDTSGVGSVPVTVAGLPAGQEVWAQGLDILSFELTNAWYGKVQ